MIPERQAETRACPHRWIRNGSRSGRPIAKCTLCRVTRVILCPRPPARYKLASGGFRETPKKVAARIMERTPGFALNVTAEDIYRRRE